MTVLDHIKSALRLIGYLAEGQELPAEMAEDALATFNQWLDSLSAGGVVVHSRQAQVVTWNAGDESMTIGPSGDHVGLRPVSVLQDTYYNDGDLDDRLNIISADEYHALALKDLSAPPHSLYVNYTVPNATMYLYPVPSDSLTLNLQSIVELTQATDVSDDVVVPPGFSRMFKYGLAIELAPEVGVEPSPTIQRGLWQAMRFVKRTNMINTGANKLSIPCELNGTGNQSIFEG